MESIAPLLAPGLHVDAGGARGQSLIDALAELGLDSDPHHSAPTAVIVGDAAAVDPAVLMQRVARAREGSNKVWVVLTDRHLVPEVEQAVPADQPVDALVVVSGDHPRATALALAAWTWLRHDAPSNAFGVLTDIAGDPCRWALVTAVAPPQAPTPHDDGNGQADRRQGDAAMEQRLAEIGQTSAVEAQTLLEAGGDVAATLIEIDSAAAAHAETLAKRVLGDWEHRSASFLTGADTRLDQFPQQDRSTELARAALARTEAGAAITAENNRTGWAARLGRRRRLEQLNADWESADEHWRACFVETFAAQCEAQFQSYMRERLPVMAQQAQSSFKQRAEQRSLEAHRRWLSSTLALAAGLALPATAPVQRSWGDANPAVRRHLLLPEAAVRTGGADSAAPETDAEPASSVDGVQVHWADGLDRPLAAAVLMGLPASSLGG